MASATKVPQGAIHLFEAKEDYIVLLLTQQEADYLAAKLRDRTFREDEGAIETSSGMFDDDDEDYISFPDELFAHAMNRTRIFTALTPVTGFTCG